MPRQARIDAPGALLHIICRGIERRNVFRDNTDRNRFLERLGAVLQASATPCYAWALIPNQFHLLLKTGLEPIATVMRRLLTGYAVTFNRRHHRYGRLFQNRYKSILCQEETYFLELVRYIHLNPIRAGIVKDVDSLERYAFAGHSRIVGKHTNAWQDVDSVLRHFGRPKDLARKRYREFVEKGIEKGQDPQLTGGGLLRSVGGWGVLKSKRKMNVHLKGDERIMGDTGFVTSVLSRAAEQMDERYQLQAAGRTLHGVIERAGRIFGVDRDQIRSAGKQPKCVQARSVAAYWAVRYLGMAATAVGQDLGLSKSAVSRAAERGRCLAREMSLEIEE